MASEDPVQRLLSVTDEELQRVVLDLHDGPVQSLFAAIAQLSSLRARLVAKGGRRDLATLSTVISLLEGALKEIRGLLSGFRSPAFAELSLKELLEEPVVEHEALTESPVDLDLSPSVDAPLAVKLTLYRILQEALSNVRRHAGNARVTVRLSSESARVILEIEDTGKGFDTPVLSDSAVLKPEHIGLRGMRQRAGLVQGVLEVRSRPGEGTKVRVEVPLRE